MDVTEPGAAEPVLRSVTLYKHGVGAFQWHAVIGEDGALVLPVPAQQIVDVLKSLLVMAAGGSNIASVAYAADEPLERRLRNFGVNLQHITGFADLLSRMIGARVRFHRGSETLEGQIIATEVVERPLREQVVRDEWLLLLLTSGAIERVELAAVRGLEVIEGESAARIREQLDLLREANQPDVARLVLTGSPGTALDLHYVAEAPVWKMTYRVVLPTAAEDKPFLQGWAIVENTSATDWNGVEVALISGMPLSFTLDLRHPRFRTRPTATIPEIDAIAPPVAEGALRRLASMPAQAADADMVALVRDEYAEERGRGVAAAKQMARRDARGMATALAESPAPPTTSRAVGELFEYHLDQPVTIPAQQAALIPVLAGTIEGAGVSVYNRSVHADHPLNAVRLSNTTGLTLDAGPITVLRDDTYAGEALIDVIKPGEERLVSYAVDLGCRVESQQQTSQRTMSRVRVRRGVLHYDLLETATTTYRFASLTDDERTVIVEHPVRPGWDMPDPPPMETTANYQRYETRVPARQSVELVVRESHTLVDSMTLLTSGADQIAWIITQINNDPAVAPVLERVAAQFRAVAERQAAVARVQAEIDALATDQARLRSNLQALGPGPEERELARRYVDELSRSEDRMGELRNALVAARQAVEAATAALHALIDEIELDQSLAPPREISPGT